MRITQLHIKNLNSLKGRWSIDFNTPEYAADGIFAITGPTGAGKSTLLDGICLALFGATPRLGRITRAGNEIMSRSTGECFAEVEFEASGGRYRCHWSQHRARRKGHGELQQHKHEIVDAVTDKVLETKVREVGLLVEKLTGLTFEQFTRSIMLAQGEFAAFLNADAGERAPILEQITGTEIYSRVSIKVHERTTDERRKTELMQTAIGAVTFLNPEEEQQLLQELEEQKKQAGTLKKDLERVIEEIHLVHAVQNTEEELKETASRMKLHEERLIREADNLTRYSRGIQAEKIAGDVHQLLKLRARKQQEQAALEECKRQYELLVSKRDPLQEQMAGRKQHLETVQSQCEQLSSLIKTVRTLDTRIGDHQALIKKNSHETSVLSSDLDKEKKHCTVLANTLRQLEEKQAALDEFLAAREADAMLVEHFVDIKSQLSTLLTLHSEEKNCRQQVLDIRNAVRLAEEKRKIAHQRYEELQNQRAHLAKRLTKEETAQADLLQGMEPAALRNRIEQLIVKEQRYNSLLELIKSSTRLNEDFMKNREELTSFIERKATTSELLAAATQKEQHQADLIEQLEKVVKLQKRILDLESERQHLEAGNPCPLCGSLEHPWAVDLPKIDGEEDSLKKARRTQQALQQTIAEHRETLAGVTRDIDHRIKAGDRLQVEIQAVGERISLLRAQLELPPEADMGESIENLKHINTELLQDLRLRNTELEKQTALLQELKKNLENAATEHSTAEHTLKDTIFRLESHLKEQQLLERKAGELQLQYAQNTRHLQKKLAPLGIVEITAREIAGLIDALESRKNTWQDRTREKESLVQTFTEQRSEREKAETRISALSSELHRKREDCTNLSEKQKDLQQERRELFMDKQPDKEEQRNKAALTEAETALNRVIKEAGELETSIHGLTEKRKAISENLGTTQKNCNDQELAVAEKLAREDFADRAEFNRALLPEEELATLAELKTSLEKQQNELSARIKEKSTDLNTLRARLNTDIPLNKLEEQRRTLAHDLEQVQQKIGAAAEKTEKNEAAKAQLQQQYELLVRQQEEEERWNSLHQLIGSADGKKFRVFAQGITFDRVIHHANRHLEQMNDRYILVRDQAHPLELQVIDTYQAEEIRSTRNLSGGESFIVSLALSLGLSSMVSRNIQVDSLFLDEGFGTLDEEALDTALHTLAALRSTGKLIGVISHVPMLRERIGLRIEVHPNADGTSILSGPGCARADVS